MKLKTNELYHIIDLLSLNSIDVKSSKMLHKGTRQLNIDFNNKLASKLQKQLDKKGK